MRSRWTQAVTNFIARNKTVFFCSLVLAIGLGTMFSDVALAVNLEDQLDRVNTLTSDKIKRYGITGAAILSVIGAMFKGNIKLVGVVIIIAITLAMFLAWVSGGMLV